MDDLSSGMETPHLLHPRLSSPGNPWNLKTIGDCFLSFFFTAVENVNLLILLLLQGILILARWLKWTGNIGMAKEWTFGMKSLLIKHMLLVKFFHGNFFVYRILWRYCIQAI